jgi:hypothetical protein
VAVILIGGGIEVPGENNRPTKGYWQTVSHSVVSSTPRHIVIYTWHGPCEQCPHRLSYSYIFFDPIPIYYSVQSQGMCSLRVLCFHYLNMSQLFRVLHNVSTILRCLQYVMVTVQSITQCIHSIAVPTLCNGNGLGYYPSTLLLSLHYVMVTVQGITQCVHSIAVPTLCNANGSGYYTMYPLYCCAYTM